MYLISELARAFGLSRSALLHYDRIGLLRPAHRSGAHYRRYTEADRARLEAICAFRAKGLGLEEIREVLARPDEATEVLRRRFLALGEEVRRLQAQQHLLARMLQAQVRDLGGLDKEAWVALFRAAGMTDEAMDAWHRAFEANAPDAHRAFLASLGLDESEIQRIRAWSRMIEGPP